MFEQFDWSDVTGSASARIREMTRTKSIGDKVNVHVIPSVAEPKPDFEAMRRLVAEPQKVEKAADADDGGKE